MAKAKTPKKKISKKKAKTSCSTEDLIKDLSKDLTPMQAARCQIQRSFSWVIFSVLYASAIGYYIGMRPDIDVVIHESVFLFEIILVGITGLFAAFSSVSMTIPDMQGRKWLKPVSFTLIGVFFLWTLTHWFGNGMPVPSDRWNHCINEAAIIALVPIAMLLYMTKRGSTTTPVLMSVMNITAVGTLAYIVLRLTCMVDEIGHIFFFYVIPFLVVGTLLGVLARRLYRW